MRIPCANVVPRTTNGATRRDQRRSNGSERSLRADGWRGPRLQEHAPRAHHEAMLTLSVGADRRAVALFANPWKALAPLAWAAYLVVPTIVTLLLVPVAALSDIAAVRFEWVCNFIGAVSLGAPLHCTCYLLGRRSRGRPLARLPLRLAWTAMMLVVATLLGAELSLPFEYPRHPGMNVTAYRLQFYRLGLLFASLWMAGLWIYDAALSHARDSALRQQVAELNARRAQLEALQVRTDPHFLYNALNGVAALISLDAEHAQSATEQLADLFRRVVEVTRRPTNSLGSELELAERYLDIERLRFEDLQLDVQVDERAKSWVVPSLLLQPLLENAVKHGRSASGKRHVSLEAHVVEEASKSAKLRLKLSNPHDEKACTSGSKATLAHLQQRLDLLYGTQANLIARSDGRHFIVLAEIPAERIA